MSVSAMAWAFEQPLPPNEKIVLLALADCENGSTHACMPGQERLADMAGMSVRTVRRMLESLEEKGVIRRARRFNEQGYRTSDNYELGVRFQAANLSGGSEPTGQITQSNRTLLAAQEPEERTGSNTPPTPSPEDEAFEAAWAAWPKKTEKKTARARWSKALRAHRHDAVKGNVTQAPVDAEHWAVNALLLDTVQRFGHAYGRTTPAKFIPGLATWLLKERWSDPMPVDQDRGARTLEPVQQQHGIRIPAGHIVVRDPETHQIIGTKPR